MPMPREHWHFIHRKDLFMKKILCVFLTVVILFTAVACSKDGYHDTYSTSEKETQGLDTLSGETETAALPLQIIHSGKTNYTIIYPSGAKNDTIYLASKAMADEIKKETGVSIKCVNDYQKESEYEILIGASKRKGSIAYESFASELDWSITLSGNKIIIAGGSDQAVTEAIAYFSKQYIKKDGISVPLDLMHIYHSEYSVIKLTKAYDQLKVTGRHIIKSEGISCDWSAAGIEFNAVCKGTVKLKLSVTVGDAYFAVYIDGVRVGTRVKAPQGESTIEIAQNLTQGTHAIRLVKLNHVYQSNTVLKELVLEGQLEARPADRNTYIEFIGDSITCGVGLSETPAYGAHGADATRAYSYICAEKLGVDYSMVSVSGHTLAWSTSKPTQSVAKQFYPYINRVRDTTPFDFASVRKPDAVVINLGTNDYGLTDLNITEQIFEQDLRTFLAQIRSNYGTNTPIVFVTNTMNDGFQGVTERVLNSLGGETQGYYLYRAIRNNNALGNHPDRAAMQTVGEGLAEFLTQKGLV